MADLYSLYMHVIHVFDQLGPEQTARYLISLFGVSSWQVVLSSKRAQLTQLGWAVCKLCLQNPSP